MGRRDWAGDVRIHDDSTSGMCPGYPAVNVKVAYRQFPEYWRLAEHYGVSDENGEKLSQLAFDYQAEYFWREVGKIVEKRLKTTDWTRAGRSGGWLEVHGLGDVEEVLKWKKTKVERWQRFEKEVHQFMNELCDWDHVIALIDNMEWVDEL